MGVSQRALDYEVPSLLLCTCMNSLMCGSDFLLNEQECPLLTLVDVMLVISTNLVLTSVSIIHNCTNTCTFITGHYAPKLTIEREHICNNRLSFNHDYTNKMYCINIYCMI